jgi:hypothetical protein
MPTNRLPKPLLRMILQVELALESKHIVKLAKFWSTQFELFRHAVKMIYKQRCQFAFLCIGEMSQ